MAGQPIAAMAECFAFKAVSVAQWRPASGLAKLAKAVSTQIRDLYP
jgi:hypothetical protein